ncbi:Uma2 family endonuclease [Aerosakkonemataceae cyanobacterium BLCC-F154]|uniref:Uma2 family endonuclease n=1 Tax=Floridaenema fluviatile BLCC-F154 TaxID=3153640 RepID=A0ABV4Y885_9CYAN
MSVQLLRRKFTVTQYHKMIEAGILKEDERIELIRGEIIEINPVSSRHAACVSRLTQLFLFRLSQSVIVSCQNPVELDDSELLPDISLLRRKADFYESGHPQPQDILLLVEVADTTVESDREIKIPLYAENGIIEVWLIDINEQSIEVYRQPSPKGYQNIQKFMRGENLSILAFSEIIISVDEVLG